VIRSVGSVEICAPGPVCIQLPTQSQLHSSHGLGVLGWASSSCLHVKMHVRCTGDA
jgi:hypothetical protein